MWSDDALDKVEKRREKGLDFGERIIGEVEVPLGDAYCRLRTAGCVSISRIDLRSSS